MKALFAACILAFLIRAQPAGSIAGSVNSSTTGAGVPGVRVELSAIGSQSAGYVATTDAAGQFSFPNVHPGDYFAAFTSNEVMPPAPGNPAKKPIHVTGGDTVRLRVELEPWGKIGGRVLDEEGRPVARVRVSMERAREGGGSITASDENGRFHISGMGPGTYVLTARPILPASSSGRPERLSSLPAHPRAGEGFTWAPTYFPGSPDRAQAQPIVIRGGSELSGYDLRLRVVPARQVRGKAADAGGQPMAKAIVKLLAMPNSFQEAQVSAGDDGAFVFSDVHPGEFRILAELARGGSEWKGSAAVTVGSKDIEDAVVRLSRPFSLQGFVDRDEPRDAQGKRKLTGVYLVPADGVLPASEFHQQGGSISIHNVYPGRYRITPVGFVSGYYLESVWLGDQNVLGQEVELTPGSPPFRVVYRAKAARVRGSVENGAGSQVFLLPQDEAFLSDQFIRSARCENGRFEVDSLRPGEYYAFAFDRVEFTALLDPGFVRGLAVRAARVHVEEGELATVDLKVTPWPE